MKPKRILYTITVILLVFVLNITAFSQGMPPTMVVTDEIRTMEFNDQITLVGRTEAWIESRIVSEVSGRVEKINANEGNWIKAGDPLVSIDSDRLRLLLDSKTAQSSQARLQAQLANTDLKRTQELYSKNLISEAALDSAVVSAGIADQRYNQLKAERDHLELDLKNSRITALYDGYTGQKLVDVGEWVSPGMPVFEMVDLSRIRVSVELPERYFGRLSIGSPVSITVSNNGSEPVQGTVIGIAPNASQETHTFPVIVEVPNQKGHLGGGMLVRATLSLDKTFASLAVSKDAIIRQGDQTMVYTVMEDKAAPIPVLTGSTNGEMIAVTGEGLFEGMPVVVRGNERIFPGSSVIIQGAEPAGQGGQESEPRTEVE